jgi:hypothetical protein
MLAGNSDMLTQGFSCIKLGIHAVSMALAMGWMTEGSKFKSQ